MHHHQIPLAALLILATLSLVSSSSSHGGSLDTDVINTIIHPIHFTDKRDIHGDAGHPAADPRHPDPLSSSSSNITTFVDYYWDARNFPRNPNTTTDRATCRMNTVPAETPNSVCNPDTVITVADAIKLNDKILEIRRKAPCVCDKQKCGTRDGHYNIGIAIARNLITLPAFTNHCATDRCRVFATQLRAVDWYDWMQVCDDGIVIALSDGAGVSGQGAVFTSTGPKARSRISNDCVDDIFSQVQAKCAARQYYDCLDDMLTFYENALTGGACGKRSGGTALTTGQIVGIVFGVIFGVALIAGLISCCVGYCQGWDCVVGTCIGSLCKCFLGCWQTIINILFIRTCCRLCGVEPLSCVEEE